MFTVVATFYRLPNIAITVILGNLETIFWDCGYEIDMFLIFMLPFSEDIKAFDKSWNFGW